MIEYAILESDKADVLAKDIAEHLNDGWELAGPLVVSAFETGRWYAQAMKRVQQETFKFETLLHRRVAQPSAVE